MARTRGSGSAKEIEAEITRIIKRTFRQRIAWSHAFGITYRENGDVILDNNRDIIDTGNLLRNLSVNASENDNIKIWFRDDDKAAIANFGDLDEGWRGTRHEFWAYAFNAMMAKVAAEIVKGRSDGKYFRYGKHL
jgi:hypothetical protein